jgi:predicted PurR-regulated permease PerM
MNFLINSILRFIASLFSSAWRFFRSLSPRFQVGIVLLLITLILMISALFYHFYTINKLQTVIETQKEGIAIKDQREINQAKDEVNNSAIESNKSIRTDSNKFSKDSKHLTNKFCEYYCKQGVLDSTCAEWAKENNRSCS